MQHLPWLRLYTEFATDPKVQMLEFADQRHFVMLLCLKGNGTLDAEYPNQEYRHRAIARALGLTVEEASKTLQILTEAHLVDRFWHPRKWAIRQAQSDRSAERTRMYRQRKKRHGDGQCDVTNAVTVTEEMRIDKNREEKISISKTFTKDEIEDNRRRLKSLISEIRTSQSLKN